MPSSRNRHDIPRSQQAHGAEFAEKEQAEDYERLGQARFGNEGRFYGGYISEADDHSAGGRDTTGPLADIIAETSREAEMQSFFGFKVKGLDGEADLLSPLKGKVVLAVNVASQCGLTPQYVDLEGLHEELADEDFAVVGFPCNQFGAQEPGSAEEIRTFCSVNYGISFPMSAKLEVNGPGRDPLYAWLTDPANGHAGDIQWNFEKFLIGRDGRLLNRYAPTVKPRDAGIMNDIAAAL